jgi:hypothetical protein
MIEITRLGPDVVVVRVNDLRSTPVDTDLVIMNMPTKNYVGLDDIGRRIWSILETPSRVDALCSRLTREYAGDPAQITRDVLEFLNELYAENLITVTADRPAGSSGAD